MAYDILAIHYPGWGLSDIKNLSPRERQWWLDVIEWRKEKARV